MRKTKSPKTPIIALSYKKPTDKNLRPIKMSMFFGGGRPQPTSAEKIAAAEQEMDAMAAMISKLTSTCLKKCIPPTYREGEINKAEGVCIDRCTAKFFEVQVKMSELMQQEAVNKGASPGS